VKIEAILFDLGKVIVDFDVRPAMQTMLDCCRSTRETFEKVLWDKAWMRRYERGEISTKDFHEYLCRAANLNMDLGHFCDTWSRIFAAEPMISYDLLAALKRHHTLVLVSNTNEAHAAYIRKNYRIFDYFDQHILSYEVGSLKPDPAIFERAIAAAGHPPGALFFTDDREENVLAARQFGMHAHQFVSERSLIQALRDAGIDIEAARG
jgi:putative hydrolase of the HAD superfamily